MVQSLDPVGVAARTLEECICLQLRALPEDTSGREVALKMCDGHLPLLANREWARLQHAVGCDEQTLHTARSLIRSLDPRPGQRFAPQNAPYTLPAATLKKARHPSA